MDFLGVFVFVQVLEEGKLKFGGQLCNVLGTPTPNSSEQGISVHGGLRKQNQNQKKINLKTEQRK